MFILFSSTAKPRYTRDALNVLAYPERSILHLRYERSLLPTHIWDNAYRWSLGRGVKQRFGTDFRALFVLVLPDSSDAKPTQETRNNRPLFPLRFGRVVMMQRDGSVLHVYFRLGRFAVPMRHAEKLSSALVGLQPIRRSRATWLTTTGAADSVFIAVEDEKRVAVEVKEPKARERGDIWEAQVRVLEQFSTFRQTLFYRVDRLRAHGLLDHRYFSLLIPERFIYWWYSQWPVEVLKHEAAFQIRRPTMHTLRVVTYRTSLAKDKDVYNKNNGRDEEFGSIAVKISDEYFVSPAEEIEVLSDYDTHFIALAPIFSSEHAVTRLTITANDAESRKVSPHVSLPIEITHPRRTLIFASLWVVMGLVAQMFSSKDGVEWLRHHPDFAMAVNRDLLSFVGGTLASACFMIAVVIVLRRAPSASFK